MWHGSNHCNPSLKTIHKHAEATLSNSKDYSEFTNTQAERMIHVFDVYKMCEDINVIRKIPQ